MRQYAIYIQNYLFYGFLVSTATATASPPVYFIGMIAKLYVRLFLCQKALTTETHEH